MLPFMVTMSCRKSCSTCRTRCQNDQVEIDVKHSIDGTNKPTLGLETWNMAVKYISLSLSLSLSLMIIDP